MTNETKKARIMQAKKETEKDLARWQKLHNDNLLCMEMDERDGYSVDSYRVERVEETKKEVDRLKAHIEKLDKMLEAA